MERRREAPERNPDPELHGASGAVRNRSHTTEQHGHTTEVLPGAQPHDQNNMLLVSGYIFVDFQTVALAGIRLPFGRPNSEVIDERQNRETTKP